MATIGIRNFLDFAISTSRSPMVAVELILQEYRDSTEADKFEMVAALAGELAAWEFVRKYTGRDPGESVPQEPQVDPGSAS